MANDRLNKPGEPFNDYEESVIQKLVDEELMKRRADEMQAEIDARVNKALNKY